MPRNEQNLGKPPGQRLSAEAEVSAVVAASIRNCTKKRLAIAEEMSETLGVKVSVHMLNDFTSSKTSHRFPASFIAAFCEITGSDELQRLVMGDRLRKLVELADRELAASQDQRKTERLRDELLNRGSRKEK